MVRKNWAMISAIRDEEFKTALTIAEGKEADSLFSHFPQYILADGVREEPRSVACEAIATVSIDASSIDKYAIIEGLYGSCVRIEIRPRQFSDKGREIFIYDYRPGTREFVAPLTARRAPNWDSSILRVLELPARVVAITKPYDHVDFFPTEGKIPTALFSVTSVDTDDLTNLDWIERNQLWEWGSTCYGFLDRDKHVCVALTTDLRRIKMRIRSARPYTTENTMITIGSSIQRSSQ